MRKKERVFPERGFGERFVLHSRNGFRIRETGDTVLLLSAKRKYPGHAFEETGDVTSLELRLERGKEKFFISTSWNDREDDPDRILLYRYALLLDGYSADEKSGWISVTLVENTVDADPFPLPLDSLAIHAAGKTLQPGEEGILKAGESALLSENWREICFERIFLTLGKRSPEANLEYFAMVKGSLISLDGESKKFEFQFPKNDGFFHGDFPIPGGTLRIVSVFEHQWKLGTVVWFKLLPE